jgi:DNA (cytosine-5)-methyltransferase 1
MSEAQVGVRRLTPLECERLQGFPDDHTRWGIDAKGREIEMSDSSRYFVAGNAVTSNVAEFIGIGITEAVGPERPF